MARAGIRRRCAAEEAADEALRDGELAEAETLLRHALEKYRRTGDTHRQGRTLLKTGIATMHEEPQDALLLFGEAEALFDPNAEPILACCARHHEIWCLNDLGYPTAALVLLERSRPLYWRFRRLKLVTRQQAWLEGRIDLRRQRHEEAEARLRLVVEMLLVDLADPYELALVGLDLLHAMAEQEGKRRQMLELLEGFLARFEELGLHPMRLSVWFILRRKVDRGLTADIDWAVLQDFFRQA